MDSRVKSNQQRRKLLKSAALGGGVLGASQLGTQWIKPVVDSVMLPAHASTTDDTGNLPEAEALLRFSLLEVESNNYGVITTPGTGTTLIATTTSLLKNILVPAVHAGFEPGDTTTTVEYYLGQISGDLYRFVCLRSHASEGDTFDTNLIDGEISIGESKDMSTLYCGSEEGSSEVELLSAVKGGVAMVALYGGKQTVTLNTDPSATPPTASTCIEIK